MRIFNNIPASFNGYAHKVKKFVYNNNVMREEQDGFTCTVLPPHWNKLPSHDEYANAFADFKKEFRNIIPDIMKIQYAHGIGGSSYNDDDEELLTFTEFQKYHKMDACKILENSFNKVLKNHKFIDETTKISVSSINAPSAHYGQGYKINFKNPYNNSEYNLFLKVFFIDYISHKNHGKIPEITRSIYLNQNMTNNKNFPEFYMGDINHDSPYMISEFVEDNAKNTSMQYPHSLLGLWFSDHSNAHNKISDYYIDAGGIRIVNILAYNPTARYVAKKIFRTPNNEKYNLWKNIFETQSSQKADKILGLCYGIQYLPKECQKDCYEKIKNSVYYKSEKIKDALKQYSF